jgi:hypothetical protein
MGHGDSDGAPAPEVNLNGVPLDTILKPEEQEGYKCEAGRTDSIQAIRQKLQRSGTSYASLPPPDSILTGKQEHCKKVF